MREVILLTFFFFVVSLFSLYLGLLTKEAILRGEIEPLFPNPSSYANSFYLLLMVLIGSALLLTLIRIKITLVRVVENVSLFFLISTTFSYFLPSSISFLLAFVLVILSELRPSFLLKNICLLLSIPSASALVGASLDFKVLLLFFSILALYDILSVALTKHMVYIAENLMSRPTALISVFPSTKVRKVSFTSRKKKMKIIALGAGDYFMTSSFCVSLLSLGIKHALLSLVFNTFAIFFLFSRLIRKDVARPLPALPFLLFSSLCALLVSFYL
ncbi:MAG: hypothetical protein LM587_02865 [Candidatus Aenigmarchaeota archaeon]|nr:hypothetical protein [Candidatus Aenigmarchaeota archaeon]